MANDVQNFKSIKPEFVTFETEGQQITGSLIGREWVELQGGTCPKYIVDTDTGRVAFLGTTQIAECLEGLPMGTVIRVTYKGELKRPGGRKLKEFDVEVADGEVNTPVNQATPEPEKAASK